MIGSGTSTGTTDQKLQVTGGAYVSGALGIGTTNPVSPLQVVGVGSTGGIRIGTLDFFPFSSGNPGSGSPTFRNSSPNSQTILRVIPNGTGTAQFEFFGKDYYADINAWDNFRVFATGTSYRIDTSFGTTGSILPIVLETGVSSAGISTNPNQLYLSTNGNIGIGTSIPVGQLQVSSGPVIIGAATSTGTSLQRLQVTGGAYVSGALGIGTTNPLGTLQVGAAGTSTFIVNSIGSVGIGTSIPTSKLHVIGDVLVSGVTTSTDFNSASDINLKENIKPIINPIDKVLQINGVSFDWKETGRSSMGVIAQEVEKVLPELVNGTDTKTVNYNGLIGLLIECVKEQQVEINMLKERLN